MLDFVRFALRNPAFITKRARRSWQTRKAMQAFRERPENARCAYCGRSAKLEVHHIEPVSVSPEKAGDADNMIMLCRKPACHQIVGHEGDFGGRYVENVRELCTQQRVVKVVKPE
jgi:hypothetical protein